MARVLIAEPSAEIHELLVHIVERLGHEAVSHADLSEGGPPAADLMLLEPGAGPCFAAARRIRRAWPTTPIVCLSIYPKSAESAALEPAAYLMKPFALGDVERAIQLALAPVAT